MQRHHPLRCGRSSRRKRR